MRAFNRLQGAEIKVEKLQEKLAKLGIQCHGHVLCVNNRSVSFGTSEMKMSQINDMED
jgi:hypothetical protein